MSWEEALQENKRTRSADKSLKRQT